MGMFICIGLGIIHSNIDMAAAPSTSKISSTSISSTTTTEITETKTTTTFDSNDYEKKT